MLFSTAFLVKNAQITPMSDGKFQMTFNSQVLLQALLQEFRLSEDLQFRVNTALQDFVQKSLTDSKQPYEVVDVQYNQDGGYLVLERTDLPPDEEQDPSAPSAGDLNNMFKLNKKAQTAPADMAASIGEDITDSTENIDKTVIDKKDKKKKASGYISNKLIPIEDGFDFLSTLKPSDSFKKSKQILQEVKENLELVNAKAVTALNKYIVALNTKEAVSQAISKLDEIREILKQAEYVETNNIARSVLIDLDSKVKNLITAIPHHLIS